MACLAALGSGALVASSALAQGQGWIPPDAQVYENEGTVMGVVPGGIQMLTERDSAWLIQVVPRQSQVKVTGTAEPGFLRSGLFVKFSGEIDAKGVLQGEVKEMEIVTPAGKNSMGVFASGSDENAKPIAKLEPGTYDIRGKVALYKDGDITIVAGKKITGKVASDAKISVNVQDYSFAQKDDTIKVKGYYYERMRPSPQEGRPGQAMGKEIEIALAKPLSAPVRKGPAKPVRPGKGKPADETPAVNTDDPFNLGGEKK